MSRWSSDSRRGAHDGEQASHGAGEGVAESFMARPDGGVDGPLDPLDQRFGGHDPAVVGEKVVFRLWADGLVSGRAIEQARSEGDQRLRLDQRLLRLHLVDEEAAAHALAEELEAPEVEDGDFPETPVLADLLPRRFVEEALALPLHDDGEVLTLAMADPIDDYAQRAIAMKTRRQLQVLIASPRRIRAEIARLYDRVAARKTPNLRSAEPAAPRPSPTPRPETGLFSTPLAQGETHASSERRHVERDDLFDEFAPPAAPAPRRRAEPEMPRNDMSGRSFADEAPEAFDGFEADLMGDDGYHADDYEEIPHPAPRPAGKTRKSDLAARLAAPRFVRPKRVTRKNRVSPTRGETERAENRLSASPTNRRFVDGFIDDFVSADGMSDFDRDWLSDTDETFEAPRRPEPTARRLAEPRARRAAPDEGARRGALAEVRRALRAQAEIADHGPVDVPSARFSRAAGAAMEERRATQETGAKYQAARALADREAQAAAQRLATDSVLRHKLVDAPFGDGVPAAPRAETSAVSPRSADGLGEIAPEDIAPEALAAVRDAIAGGDGLILFAGPAGSAKLASLRALAEEAAGGRTEVLRLDRPADRVRLAQSNSRRVALGEIRDAESAEAAVRIAMTGGLVFAAIDASSACSAPERMISLGVPAYALASSLRVAATQSLNERGCLRCAQTGRSVTGEPCPECSGAGVERRAALTEAMVLDDSLRALILARAPDEALRHAMETPKSVARPRRPRRNQRAVRRIANAALSGAYGFGAP